MAAKPLVAIAGSAPIAVIGLGTIGASWAALFLANGHPVHCYDSDTRSEERSRALIGRAWRHVRSTVPLEQALDMLSFQDSVQSAVTKAAFVQENVPEDLDLKCDTLSRIEASAGEQVVIASSTSGIPPSAMQSRLVRPERFLVSHPFNPPHLMPLVELVPGGSTSPDAIDVAQSLYERMGKICIRLAKEVPGHVANRLQAALWREAVHLAVTGVASIRDIDLAVTAGPGLRWASMGPHTTFHVAGGDGGMAHFLDHLGPAFEAIWADLGRPDLDAATRSILIEGLAATDPDALAAERDGRLVRILRALSPEN